MCDKGLGGGSGVARVVHPRIDQRGGDDSFQQQLELAGQQVRPACTQSLAEPDDVVEQLVFVVAGDGASRVASLR